MYQLRHRTGILTGGVAGVLIILCSFVHASPVRISRAIHHDSPASTEVSIHRGCDRAITGFHDRSAEQAPVATHASVLYDDSTVQFVVQCHEPKMQQLRADCKSRDGDVFSDDCVEIFVYPASKQFDHYYHFAVNAIGTRFDERVVSSTAARAAKSSIIVRPLRADFTQHEKQRQWDADWSVDVCRGNNSWTVAATIPFSAIGGPPEAPAVYFFNLCRQRRRDDNLQLMAWSPTGTDFHDVHSFGVLFFGMDPERYLKENIIESWQENARKLLSRAEAALEDANGVGRRIKKLRGRLQPLTKQAESLSDLGRDRLRDLFETGENALAELAKIGSEVNKQAAASRHRKKLRKLAADVSNGQKLLVYSVKPISNRRILHTPQPPEEISRKLILRACRGEYEPASFVVYPPEHGIRLQVRATDLQGPAGTISPDAIDIRAVKRWYQSGKGGRFPINRGLHALTPELLLKDDDLVRVDHNSKQNFVKLKFPNDRREWLWISSPQTTPEQRDASVEAMPIRDAETLQPVFVAADTAKQFWVTVNVPQKSEAGIYTGAVELVSSGRVLTELPVELEVLPFELAENPLESSIYFHWGIEIDRKGGGTVRHHTRTWQQYRAELQNLLAHGVDNPTLGVSPKEKVLKKALTMRRDVGMTSDKLYYLTARAAWSSEKLKRIMKIADGFGYKQVYFYGRDEARGEALKQQRKDWKRVHKIGGKVFVAGSRGHNFPALGDIQDLLVCYGDPKKKEATKWHSEGHKIFCYANPQSGIEEPETYRRNYGLLLAANNYDGGMTYIYYHGWNDYSGDRYRQHNFVYPTTEGVIDTVQWEGYREGIDDLRYLGTLRKCIARARQTGGKATKKAADAQAFIDNMDVSGDLYKLRERMIEWILTLKDMQK